jgi:hypothetical protein
LNPDIVANERRLLDLLLREHIHDLDHGRGQVESIRFHREFLVIRKRSAWMMR